MTTQPDLIRHSPCKLAEAYRTAAETERRSPYYSREEADRRAAYYEREAQAIESTHCITPGPRGAIRERVALHEGRRNEA